MICMYMYHMIIGHYKAIIGIMFPPYTCRMICMYMYHMIIGHYKAIIGISIYSTVPDFIIL